jgi:hypothetical protein
MLDQADTSKAHAKVPLASGVLAEFEEGATKDRRILFVFCPGKMFNVQE